MSHRASISRGYILDYIKNHQSIGIGNRDHTETVVEARGACTVKRDEGYPIQIEAEFIVRF